MRMKRITAYRLPGREIRSLEEFYDVISQRLSLPKHFGRNLDALWDVLTTDVKGPVKIIWEESAVQERPWDLFTTVSQPCSQMYRKSGTTST